MEKEQKDIKRRAEERCAKQRKSSNCNDVGAMPAPMRGTAAMPRR
jgi:hypothetical protein